jgi:pyruvate dehydrogenase E1 component alpha subunit
LALANKIKVNDRVSLCFFGDGASNEGAVHETANLAAIWNLPLIMICENNGYCISLPVSKGIRIDHISDRAAGYGIAGDRVDGNDPIAVFEGVSRAVKRARCGDGPSFIEAITFRLGGHLVHDPQRYRSQEEIKAAWEKCPIKVFGARLQHEGLITPTGISEMETEVAREVEAAVQFARESPPPRAEEAFEDLWA